MDGNGRWAKQKKLLRISGHKAGLEALKSVVDTASEEGVEALTVFAFSSENWRRPKKEVRFLLELFVTALKREVARLHKDNVQLRFIGDKSRFSRRLKNCIRDAEALTENNVGLKLRIAANYGGRWDIIQASKLIANDVTNGDLKIENLDEATFSQYMSISDLPEPDLFIRTSGESRISNFLIWDLAYTELYFTETLWPDFNPDEFKKALEYYRRRNRRFGYTGEQMEISSC